MFSHGLKINISVHLAILAGAGMLLIDFVMIIAVQNLLLASEISKGYILLSAIETNVINFLESPENVNSKLNFHKHMANLAETSKISCATVLDRHNRRIYFSGKNCTLEDKLHKITRETIESGSKRAEFFGTVWGVFWKQSQNAVLSAPLFQKGNIVAGTGIVIPLEGVSKGLRNTQQMVFIYILINTIALTLAGLYQLSKQTVKPLHRLLKRAEDYRDNSDFFFFGEKENNEFNQLSKALNRMLNRIANDKEELQAAVHSLEKANTDLKHAQKEIVRAEKLASVGRLSAGIAHEIGNPLGIVLGYLELMKQEDITPDEKNEFVLRAEDEIRRIDAIIRQLLDFSRSSAEGSEPVSVHKLIHDITKMLDLQPLMSKIELELSLRAEKDTVFADPNRLRQVFLNLAINAADAVSSVENHPGGRLTITSESEDSETGVCSMLKLMIIDNGCGIPEEHLGNIFDPFYTTKEPGKGTGLGLSVSFRIIESLGGTIRAVSEEGKGTTMIICLPICE
jgi:signal transduction histidine kinase